MLILNNNTAFKYSFYCDYFILENQLDIEKCFHYILDYFVCNGLLQNDEPSDYGIEIENINQIINHQLVLNNSENEFAQKKPTVYLKAKTIFLKCNGNIDNLDDETKKIYKKLKIPTYLEENWLNYISNIKIEQKSKK